MNDNASCRPHAQEPLPTPRSKNQVFIFKGSLVATTVFIYLIIILFYCIIII